MLPPVRIPFIAGVLRMSPPERRVRVAVSRLMSSLVDIRRALIVQSPAVRVPPELALMLTAVCQVSTVLAVPVVPPTRMVPAGALACAATVAKPP